MWTASRIRRHFLSFAENTMVSRKELLQYGTQDAVDSALAKLLMAGVIIRMACGVYLRQIRRSLFLPLLKLRKRGYQRSIGLAFLPHETRRKSMD